VKISAAFVTSAASAADFPGDGLSEVALVGRSNVGKSSLINALTRQRVARTSAAPGKTRLANIYSVARGSSGALYLVDLPGYGYARGGAESAQEFADLTRAYFGREEPDGQESRVGTLSPASVAALLLGDCRLPGLEGDRRAWAWLRRTVAGAAVVATKVDKLARGQRIRALRELESVFEDSVLPVSAVTGEGLDELLTLIDKLANSRNPNRRSNSRSRPPRATAPWPSRKVLQLPKGRRPKK
jgi:GTP-binding protein